MNKSVVGVLIVVILIGTGYWLSRPKPVEVQLYSVSRGTVEATVANTRAGSVVACQRSRLSLPIGGQIDQLKVTEGDRVERGQLLLSLWNEDRKAFVEQARAASLSAQKERDAVCISAGSDRVEAQRQNRLLAQQLTSIERADLAEARANAAEASCAAAKARFNQSLAGVRSAQASLEQTFLYAPFDGIVAQVTGELGEFSTPSPPGVPTPPAIDLLTDNCHYISAPIDEVDASTITLGMPVRVTLDAFRGRALQGTVRRIASYVTDREKQARTVEVEVQLEEQSTDIVMLAGYSADIEVLLQVREQALRVPTSYIADQNRVLILDNGVIAARQVTVGLSNWHFTEIVSGLAEGDQVIANIGSSGVTVGAGARAAGGKP